ncbi:MAG: YbaB/EbfC family nucleoid-associated protein [Oscillospiraceae bacterium]
MKARLPQGYGKQNINELMQQAQQMQENVRKKQDELEAKVYTVSAGGGMIELTMTGKHQVTAVKIKPEAVDPSDIEMLEDLVAAAFNETVRVVDEAADAEMDELTSGYNIPGM